MPAKRFFFPVMIGQTHLDHRCEEMIKIASPTAARFPLRVQAALQEGLALRDRYEKQQISLHGLWTATGRLEVKLDRVLASRLLRPAKKLFQRQSRLAAMPLLFLARP
jgi:hypothetical protein